LNCHLESQATSLLIVIGRCQRSPKLNKRVMLSASQILPSIVLRKVQTSRHGKWFAPLDTIILYVSQVGFRPTGRLSSKIFRQDRQMRWNTFVNEYILTSGDRRAKIEIEHAAKLASSLGTLHPVCEGEGCEAMAGLDKLHTCSRCKMVGECSFASLSSEPDQSQAIYCCYDCQKETRRIIRGDAALPPYTIASAFLGDSSWRQLVPLHYIIFLTRTVLKVHSWPSVEHPRCPLAPA
jgi:hypothetical protein